MISRRFIRFATTSGLILAAMGAPGVVRAQTAPVVTGVAGTVQAGGSLTITGSGFGQKPVAAPLKWDNFEGGTIGTTIANGWATGATCNYGTHIHACKAPQYSNTVLRTNSTRSATAFFEDEGWTDCPDGEGCQWESSFGVTGNPANSSHYIPGFSPSAIYIDAWVYYNAASPESRNVKILRVHTNTYTPSIYLAYYCPQSSDGAVLGSSLSDAASINGSPWRGATFWIRSWRHIQLYMIQSTPGIQDGTAWLSIDGVVAVNRIGTWKTRNNVGEYWDTIWMGNYLGHGLGLPCLASPGNSYQYWDDAYVDTTRAHVEIGNAATYSACTHREIQIPSAWSATSITITANQGAFATLANAYLFVVDRNGAANTVGYLLGGSGGDAVSPAAVRDLRTRTGP